MGSKAAAKQLMRAAGVPLVAGYDGEDQSPQLLRSEANRIGYPVLIKPSAGGGGKGMRIVQAEGEFPSALAQCQREAQASFADERVLIEKYLQQPHHIEVQVFGDATGRIISLFERDCSVQRRHQKVLEEAPAVGLDRRQLEAMAEAACRAAAAVNYVGAGTVEFIVEPNGTFYFMEMNTRLQVEHPVTEMITGLDLVEWQLRVAAGEPLPLQQSNVAARGHSIEVRIYAEEPEKGFLPSTGVLVRFQMPLPSAFVRVDTGVECGDVVSPYYDPMLAKLIVWGETRVAAIERLQRAIADVQIVGVGNNRAFLARLAQHPAFRRGQVDTGFVERESGALLAGDSPCPEEAVMAAALWIIQREKSTASAEAKKTADVHSPWSCADGWRLNAGLTRGLTFSCADAQLAVNLEYLPNGMRINGRFATVEEANSDTLTFRVGEGTLQANVVESSGTLHVFIGGRESVLTQLDLLAHAGEDQETYGGLTAPMSGSIVELLVPAGTRVEKGQPVLVMEAMKMEHVLRAPAGGQVREFLFQVGQQVKEGADLVDFETGT
jgi:3-methylcrotonyl-CoA carboxylase alpha subunit